MSRKREEPIHPQILDWMQNKGEEEIQDTARRSGVPHPTVSRYADMNYSAPAQLLAAYRLAKHWGLTLDELVEKRFLQKQS